MSFAPRPAHRSFRVQTTQPGPLALTIGVLVVAPQATVLVDAQASTSIRSSVRLGQRQPAAVQPVNTWGGVGSRYF